MKKLFIPLFAIALAGAFSACDKTSPDMTGNGHLVVKVTDAPFPVDMIESATVTITKVELRKAGDGIPDGYPFIVLMEDTVTFDLLDLRNGVTEELLAMEIPAGTYNLMRLYVEEASLKIKDGETYSVKVPSGKQTGIKIFVRPEFHVTGGLTTELLLDFDLSRSFLMIGSFNNPRGINGFHFKPVIRAVNNSTAGRIMGMVSDTSKVKIVNAQVWVAQDTVVAEAYTDTLGHYAIIGLPAGKYSVFATKEDYDTVSYENVDIFPGNLTIKDFMLTHK
ncbi:MAG TPA: DUF4382 domain-containing protein [Bacteroidales bacterium]|nr:DUF4382 domain-containing protein [Bacteroidales bacterium]HPF04149.1 DUF4382 domain-containing protein [Bacteroidales bacterium]HPJ60537.1 DUF4382 domain-containing protein [Bacteroidales bacterium]HPR13486.1 DUF4382 domain-containing protein [Bacteroidales bacterium]HRW86295.1 DUF4382 domain-containing protein [Bacteroidales bacterium]